MIRFMWMLIAMILFMPMALFAGGFTEWAKESWLVIVGTIGAVFAALWIPGLRTLVVLGLKTLVSERVLKAVFIALAEKLVKSTTTTVDDIWLAELKKKM